MLPGICAVMAFGAHNATRGFTRHRATARTRRFPNPARLSHERLPGRHGIDAEHHFSRHQFDRSPEVGVRPNPFRRAPVRRRGPTLRKTRGSDRQHFSRFFSQPAGICQRVDFATALSVRTEQVFGQAGLTSPAIRGVSTLPATSSRKCPYPTFIQRFYSRLRHSLRSPLAYDCGQIG